MAIRTRDLFFTVRTEGAILPADLLQRVVDPKTNLEGLNPEAYHLPKSEKLTEATNRSWNRLLGFWETFRAAAEKLLRGEPGTSVTRERWLLPLFQELGYGRLLTAKALAAGGKSYPISHGWNLTPIHLLGCRVDLDKPTQGIAGAARRSPHSLVQELLNRSVDHLWGIVSNGVTLRILRNNASLTRQAYVEFDLEAMMLGENYSDFVLLWLLCHQSRVEAEKAENCWLEKWSKESRDSGVRALDQLRAGVERAITALGRGFLAHPGNTELRQRLSAGVLSSQDYYRQILRVVYRLLFLFTAEDRCLLLMQGDDTISARERFVRFYSTARLRRLAERRTGTRHNDLYIALRLVMQKLGSDEGCAALALPALGSFLFARRATPDIDECEIANRDLLDAVRALAVTTADGVWRSVDYKNLGAEELGSVYESLLELQPRLNLNAATFELESAVGNERKTTGSYYTDTTLVDCLLDSALNPVLEDAARKANPEAALLGLKVVDPACGSGHFLIAAAHRIAKSLAAVRTGDDEPSPEATRTALRDVVGRCIHGVDLNPMAVELCKVNLWIEAVQPGKPLSFLEHRIQCGNALLGATPSLMQDGIPNDAFSPLVGDTPEACTKWKAVNKAERVARSKKQGWLGFDAPLGWLMNYATGLMSIEGLGDDSIAGIHEKEERYEQVTQSKDYLDGKFLADAWCAAFVWTKNSLTEFPITEEVYREIEQNPTAFYDGRPGMSEQIQRLARRYMFLHWHLAFPDVFRFAGSSEEAENKVAGWDGGFDCVVGNPPWERIKLQEKEWFAKSRPDIANAATAATRRKMVAALSEGDPALFNAYQDELRAADGEGHLIRNSGRYPLCGKGDINTYAIFAESNRNLVGYAGRFGCIVPTGIATDDTTKEFFASIVESNTLVSMYDFENAVGLFEGVGHGRFKFCLLTLSGRPRPTSTMPDFFFFAHHVGDLNIQHRHFTLTAEDIGLINPNTHTCPIFRSQRDVEITKTIYRRVPVLIKKGLPKENAWGVKFSTMFHMSNDSYLFRSREQLEAQGFELRGNSFVNSEEKYLPLYEAKMFYHFTHRYGDYAMRPEGSQDSELPRIPSIKLQDPQYSVMPRYWVEQWEVIKAASNVPRILVQAVNQKSEESAGQVLAAWFAGCAIANAADKDGGDGLVRHLLSVWRAMKPSVQRKFCMMALHDEYPLDESDFLCVASGTTYLRAADQLIRRRTPEWLLSFRDICRSTDERTSIFAALPLGAVGNNAPLLGLRSKGPTDLLYANVCSFVFDYIVRQKAGGTHLNFFIVQQFPVLQAESYSEEEVSLIRMHVLELVYTDWSMQPFAREFGYEGPPFKWFDDRRFLLRCELDAIYFHRYGIARDDADFILDTFLITKRKEILQFGEYRTKRVILEIYDSITEAARQDMPYQTRLDPPPASPLVAHAKRSVL